MQLVALGPVEGPTRLLGSRFQVATGYRLGQMQIVATRCAVTALALEWLIHPLGFRLRSSTLSLPNGRADRESLLCGARSLGWYAPCLA